jgi:RNA polymerase sigma-70 factor (ECF subfamily)
MNQLNEEKLIDDFRKHDIGSLKFLYQEYRKDFVKWASFKYTIGEEEAADVYSDAVIDVYHNIVNGRYQKSSTASLKSYLYEVGKNKILNILNKNRISETHLKIIYSRSDSSYNLETGKNAEMVEKVKELMNLIDQKCRKVLTLYYFHSLSMDMIAKEMDFKNDDVAKNKKLKCFKRLQALVFERFKRTDFFE